MCTVTYLPIQGGFVLTSNRDEQSLRQPALHPAIYNQQNASIIYPKDTQAEGSWIALKENGEAGVLLNGAFYPHQKRSNYRRSRGLIFLDIMASNHPSEAFACIPLEDIEPFTLVLIAKCKLIVCRWDSTIKHTEILPNDQPYIWSSCTLYKKEVVQQRESWFADWLHCSSSPDQHALIKFHEFGGEGDVENSLRMNRKNEMLTVSITSILVENNDKEMYYRDTQNERESRLQIQSVKCNNDDE